MTAHCHLPDLKLAGAVYHYTIIDEAIPEFWFVESNVLCFNLDAIALEVDGEPRTGPILTCSRLRQAPRIAKPPGRLLYVLLDQGVWSRLLGIDPSTIDRTIVALALEHYPELAALDRDLRRTRRDTGQLIARLDRFFLAALAAAEPEGLAEQVRVALVRDHTVRIPVLAERVGCSQRTLERAFKQRYGLTARRYAKIVRALRSLRDSPLSVSWAEVPPDLDYTDQSHWIRDIRNMHGLTPSQMNVDESYPWLYYPRGSLLPEEASAKYDGHPDWREFVEATRLV